MNLLFGTPKKCWTWVADSFIKVPYYIFIHPIVIILIFIPLVESFFECVDSPLVGKFKRQPSNISLKINCIRLI